MLEGKTRCECSAYFPRRVGSLHGDVKRLRGLVFAGFSYICGKKCPTRNGTVNVSRTVPYSGEDHGHFMVSA